MSFSGLKTALLRTRDAVVAEKGGVTIKDRSDLCAGFQAAVADVLSEKSRRALRLYLADGPEYPALAVAGGVAANGAIRSRLTCWLMKWACASSLRPFPFARTMPR